MARGDARARGRARSGFEGEGEGLVGLVQPVAKDPFAEAEELGRGGAGGEALQECVRLGGVVAGDEDPWRGRRASRRRLRAGGEALAEPALAAGGELGRGGGGTLPDGGEEVEGAGVLGGLTHEAAQRGLGLGPERAGDEVLGGDAADEAAGGDGLAERARGGGEASRVGAAAVGGVEGEEAFVGSLVEAVGGEGADEERLGGFRVAGGEREVGGEEEDLRAGLAGEQGLQKGECAREVGGDGGDDGGGEAVRGGAVEPSSVRTRSRVAESVAVSPRVEGGGGAGDEPRGA